MAKLNYGIFGPLIGKISNTVGYVRKGQALIRIKTKKTKKKLVRTDAQKAVNVRFKMAKEFVSGANEFLNVGYELDVSGTTMIPENGATSYLLQNAFIGEYPDLKLDYSKVLVSRGKLPPPLHPTVKLEGDILRFTWEVDPDLGYQFKTDQVMLLAYMPANKNANCLLSGARRNQGAEVLEVDIIRKSSGNVKKDEFIEVYVAFISDDRKRISDSVYVGSVPI